MWGFSLLHRVDSQSYADAVLVAQMRKPDLWGCQSFFALQQWTVPLKFLLANGQYSVTHLTFLLFSSFTRGRSLLNASLHILTPYVSLLLDIVCFPFCCCECLESLASFHFLYYLSKKLLVLKYIRWKTSSCFCLTSFHILIAPYYQIWKPKTKKILFLFSNRSSKY